VYKQCLFLWRKPGMERQKFKKYYDEAHLECVSKELPSPPLSHQRNYPVWDDALTIAPPPDSAFDRFDAFATVTFGDANQREEWRQRLLASQTAREAIERDEAEFIDTGRRMMCVVEEAATARPAAGGREYPDSAHVLRFVKYRGNGLSRDKIKELHEKEVASSLGDIPQGVIRYQRNYLLPEHPWSYFRMPAGSASPTSWVDIVEEFTFADRATAPASLQRLNELFRASDSARPRDSSTAYVERSCNLPERWRAK
jgi:hypothetical protein